jgi:hypothetical protein
MTAWGSVASSSRSPSTARVVWPLASGARDGRVGPVRDSRRGRRRGRVGRRRCRHCWHIDHDGSDASHRLVPELVPLGPADRHDRVLVGHVLVPEAGGHAGDIWLFATLAVGSICLLVRVCADEHLVFDAARQSSPKSLVGPSMPSMSLVVTSLVLRPCSLIRCRSNCGALLMTGPTPHMSAFAPEIARSAVSVKPVDW